ncbi:MAG: hypothetical protein ABW174_00135 [Flavitalea sp.]
MQKKIYLLLSLSLVILSCSKFEQIKDHFDDPAPGNKNDFTGANAQGEALKNYQLEPIPYLFKKIYNGDKLKQIITGYYNHGVGLVEGFDSLAVIYTSQQVIFLRSNKDTAASFTMHANGKPIKARASRLMRPGEPLQTFNFIYSNGKLEYLLMPDNMINDVYAKIQYEAGKKNISSLSVQNGTLDVNDKITYTWDHTKKVKSQFYADEGTIANFWKFLCYLNWLEELNGENLLQSVYIEGNDYPYDMIRKYSNHKLDSKGRLTSYYASETRAEHGTENEPRKWIIYWK